MNTLNRRLYKHNFDLRKMIELIKMVRPTQNLDYPGIVDLQEMLSIPAIQKNTRLWETPDAELAGFTIIDLWDNIWFEFKPGVISGEIEKEILNWGETCVRLNHTIKKNKGLNLKLDTNCREDNYERIDFLERNGFFRQAIQTIKMARSLHEPIQKPELPSGFLIRHVAGESEIERWVALHQAAFESNEMTVEYRLSMMRVPGYDPQLDLIVVNSNGQFVAFCFSRVSLEMQEITGRREGSTDMLGTHPAYRKKGVAKALLLTSLRLLKGRGVTYTSLGTTSENIAMQKTAKSVGFHIETVKPWFSKPIMAV
jgi:ribosomal protein S18 acetylase RimI-like enzyme